MVTTRNQGGRVDGGEANASRSASRDGDDGPTVAEMAELLKNVSAELERTKAELQNVINQRDAFARVIEDAGDAYSDRRNRGPSPTRSVTGATPRRGEEGLVNPNRDKGPVVVQGGNGGGNNGSAFEYGNFLKCKPEPFKGGQDPVVNLRWLKQMEVVFESCDCSEGKKVLFASRMLKESALDWWTGRKAALGTDYIASMTWSSFSKLFEAKYCTPRDKIVLEREFLTLKKGDKSVEEYVTAFHEKLQFCVHLCPDDATTITRFIGGLPAEYRGLCRTKTTMNDVIDEAKHIEDDLRIKEKKEGSSGVKRKSEEDLNLSKKFRSDSNYEGKDDKKVGKWCSPCKAYHEGPCSDKTRRCNKCGKQGHVAPKCLDETRCYKCDETDHMIADCPQGRNDAREDDIPKDKARAYQMITMDDESDDEVFNKVVL